MTLYFLLLIIVSNSLQSTHQLSNNITSFFHISKYIHYSWVLTKINHKYYIQFYLQHNTTSPSFQIQSLQLQINFNTSSSIIDSKHFSSKSRTHNLHIPNNISYNICSNKIQDITQSCIANLTFTLKSYIDTNNPESKGILGLGSPNQQENTKIQLVKTLNKKNSFSNFLELIHSKSGQILLNIRQNKLYVVIPRQQVQKEQIISKQEQSEQMIQIKLTVQTWTKQQYIINWPPSFEFKPAQSFKGLISKLNNPFIVSEQQYYNKIVKIYIGDFQTQVMLYELMDCFQQSRSDEKWYECEFEQGDNMDLLYWMFPLRIGLNENKELKIQIMGGINKQDIIQIRFVVGIIINIISLLLFIYRQWIIYCYYGHKITSLN